MAKFYVQSGSFRGVVDCYDEECAAVWAIHRVMLRSSSESLQAGRLEEVSDDTLGDAMFDLGESIRVNERGFDSTESREIDLHVAFLHWHQLRKAIEAINDAWDEKLGD